MQSMSQEVKNRQFEAQVATSEFKSFKDALAVLLSDSESHCENREDFIRERVKNLQLAHRESSAVSCSGWVHAHIHLGCRIPTISQACMSEPAKCLQTNNSCSPLGFA